jgi:hypothetical protein
MRAEGKKRENEIKAMNAEKKVMFVRAKVSSL